jgi:hypothetical protein
MFDQGRVYIERAAAAGCQEAMAELHSIAVSFPVHRHCC